MEEKIFKDSFSFFSNLYSYLENGYIILDSPFLCLKLKNGEKEVVLKLEKEGIKTSNFIYPNYSNTLLNVIAGFKHNYGFDTCYEVDKILFDKKYEHTIILILDGLGVNILNKFGQRYKNNFLAKNFYKKITSIYPSTTTASTTAIKTGKVPLETGWTGWQNWIREINQNVTLFMKKNYYTGEDTTLCGYDILPYKYYFNDLSVLGTTLEPNFNDSNYNFKNTLDRAYQKILEGYQTMYLYDESPDRELHKLGTNDDSIYQRLNNYSKLIEEFYNKLPPDTLFIISADHGHIDIDELNLFEDKYLYKMLERNPSNDSRCLTFKVKDSYRKEFVSYFNSVYGKIYKLYDTKEAIERGFFGSTDKVSNRIDDFLADYVALSYTNYQLCSNPKSIGMKSSHAGITKEEMEVPLIVLKK